MGSLLCGMLISLLVVGVGDPKSVSGVSGLRFNPVFQLPPCFLFLISFFPPFPLPRELTNPPERRTKDHIRSIHKLSISSIVHYYCVTGSADGDVRVWVRFFSYVALLFFVSNYLRPTLRSISTRILETDNTPFLSRRTSEIYRVR